MYIYDFDIHTYNIPQSRHMKHSKLSVRRKYSKQPFLQFENQRLTSFSGLILFQKLFSALNLKNRLAGCFKHLRVHPIYGFNNFVLFITVHVLLGFRKINDMKYYSHDPMVKRLVGVDRLPDPSRIARAFSGADENSMVKCRHLLKNLVIEQFLKHRIKSVTADFDGTVLSTTRHAENTAVGFNKKKKGLRSYYPLFCTIAQTGQVLDFHHRPGNVHDSNGSVLFVKECFESLKAGIPGITIESRMDGAFFSDEMVGMLTENGGQFTISVPFLRMTELKGIIESRRRWRPVNEDVSYFEMNWKPKSWSKKYRFIFVRRIQKVQHKEPIQLDLFVPDEYEYGYSVIITNKQTHAFNVITYHGGRGSQESVFAELKSQTNMDYIPFKKLLPNKFFLFSCVLAHNLTRELQMSVFQRGRSTNFKRASLWTFQQMNTLRRNLISRAGRLTWPQGKLTLTVSANRHVEKEFRGYYEKIKTAA